MGRLNASYAGRIRRDADQDVTASFVGGCKRAMVSVQFERSQSVLLHSARVDVNRIGF